MSVPFFYEPTIIDTNQPIVLSDNTSKHCVQVLRMREGALIHLTDGKGKLFKAKIISADKHKSVALIENTVFTDTNPNRISIGISLLKNADRLEWMFEKITEIGVTEIFPLICKRTEQQRFRTERMLQILVSAMLHSQLDQKLLLKDLPKSSDALILIGPEGDFTIDEISLALQSQFIPVSLGETRLRTETAGLVSITLLVNR